MKTSINLTHEQCILAICQFARQYQAERERTPRHLYKDTGYHAYFENVTQKEIEITVEQNSSLIDDWIHFTEDKRWTPAWGLVKRNKNSWVIFHILKNGVKNYEVLFDNPISACALMIRMEMEDFRLRSAS